MFKRRTRQGFTLVECLFSLLILALLFEAAVLTLQSYQRWIKAAETDHGLEWQNFVMVFEAELNHFQVQQVGQHTRRLDGLSEPCKGRKHTYSNSYTIWSRCNIQMGSI